MGKPKMLIVDDEKEICTFFKHLFKKDYDITVVCSGKEAEKAANSDNFDIAFVDLKLNDSDGLTVLNNIKKVKPHCSVIIMTGYSTVSTAVQAIRQGAYNYIEKPFEDLNYLKQLARDALGGKGEESTFEDENSSGFFIGQNEQMQNIASMARKVAGKKVTVLIEGETGTGKEVLARFIHRNSNRADYPFLAVNCGAFTENLLESELFGHEKGAFTGALSSKQGIFEMANNGTLFLDEIGEASLTTQVKLLRVLESPQEIYRVGGTRPYKCNVRLIAATNTDLKKAVESGSFREDLYYRLNVINLKLPPLRDRKEDIPVLIKELINRHFGYDDVIFTGRAMDLLVRYNWPGNIRELLNVIEHIMALYDGKEVSPDILPAKIYKQKLDNVNIESTGELGKIFINCLDDYFSQKQLKEGINLSSLISEMKKIQSDFIKIIINRMLSYAKGNRAEAARLLNINKRRLQYYLKEK